jgi:hypothetical protein
MLRRTGAARSVHAIATLEEDELTLVLPVQGPNDVVRNTYISPSVGRSKYIFSLPRITM